MTDTAVFIGRYVSTALAFGELAVMTGCTVIDDSLMIESGTGECGRVMTH